MILLNNKPSIGVIQMNVYVINLKRRPDRLAQMTAEYGPTFFRIDALDGNDPEADLGENNLCLDPESACWLSHQRAWQAMIANSCDYALILEDDAQLNPNYKLEEVYSRAMHFVRSKNIDLLQLGFFQDLGRKKSLLIKLRVLKEKVPPLNFLIDVSPNQHGIGTHAYLISRNGAEKLSQINRPVFLAADAALMYLAQGQTRPQKVKIWQLRNSIFHQRPLSPSNRSDVQ
jgi:GR25 family glycosyltransferase involved in LPS biosynthesis